MLETDIGPQYAYELEEQMLAVAEAQERGWLTCWTHFYRGRKAIHEQGVKWYFFKLLELKLAAYDCDEKLLKKLRIEDTIREIRVPGERPDLCFGRSDYLVAAVLNSKNQPIYKSPLFDLNTYLRLES